MVIVVIVVDINVVFNMDRINVYNRINVDIVVNIVDVVWSGNRINVNMVLVMCGISSWVFNMDGSNNINSGVVYLSINVDISMYVFNVFYNFFNMIA